MSQPTENKNLVETVKIMIYEYLHGSYDTISQGYELDKLRYKLPDNIWDYFIKNHQKIHTFAKEIIMYEYENGREYVNGSMNITNYEIRCHINEDEEQRFEWIHAEELDSTSDLSS